MLERAGRSVRESLREWVTRAGALAGELWSGGRGPILVAVAAGWFLSLGVRLVYPAILPYVRAEFGLDLATAGLLLTTLWIAYALGQLPGGILDDRLGARAVLVASTGLSALFLGFVVLADSRFVLFAATALFGLSTALYGVARFTVMSNVFPAHDGTAVGLTMAAGDLGNSLLPPAAGFLAAALAWQYGIGAAIPLFVVAAIGIAALVPRDTASFAAEWADSEAASVGEGSLDADDNEPAVGQPSGVLATVRAVIDALSHRSILLVTLIQTLGYCVWQAFTGFYPTYLIEVKGLAAPTATLLFGGFFALGIVVKPITGAAYDAHGARSVLPAVMAVLALAMGLLPFVDSLPGIIVVTALASAVLGYATVTLTYLTAALPAAIQGTALGSLRTGYMVLGAASPTVMGVIAEAGYFDEGFLLLAVVAAVTVGLSLFVPERTQPVAVEG